MVAIITVVFIIIATTKNDAKMMHTRKYYGNGSYFPMTESWSYMPVLRARLPVFVFSL